MSQLGWFQNPVNSIHLQTCTWQPLGLKYRLVIWFVGSPHFMAYEKILMYKHKKKQQQISPPKMVTARSFQIQTEITCPHKHWPSR